LGAFQGWFHKNCITELKCKKDEELNDENFVYECEKCRESRHIENNKKDMDYEETA